MSEAGIMNALSSLSDSYEKSVCLEIIRTSILGLRKRSFSYEKLKKNRIEQTPKKLDALKEMPNKDVTNSLKRTKKIDNKVNKNEKTSNLYKEFSNEKNAIYYVGQIIWGKLEYTCYWPGMVVDGRMCGMDIRLESNNEFKMIHSDENKTDETVNINRVDEQDKENNSEVSNLSEKFEKNFLDKDVKRLKLNDRKTHAWVFWFGDHKISKMSLDQICDFEKNFHLLFNFNKNKKIYMKGIYEALQLCFPNEDWRKVPLESIKLKVSNEKRISVRKETKDSEIPKWIEDILHKYAKVNLASSIIGEDEDKELDSDDEEENDQNDDCSEKCVTCKIRGGRFDHPFLVAKFCAWCRNRLALKIFDFGSDGFNMCCVLCGCGGEIILCDQPDCHKSFCIECLEILYDTNGLKAIKDAAKWMCMTCGGSGMCKVKARTEWKKSLYSMFQLDPAPSMLAPSVLRPKLRVLSLFDGISTGMVVLKSLGIEVEAYFSSEIDEDSLLVSGSRHAEIIQVGCVLGISNQKLEELMPIDLLIGGSPCNDFSIANPNRKDLHPDGSGMLFLHFKRIVDRLRSRQATNVWWLYENVASMHKSCRDAISVAFGCYPATHDAKYLSSQNRKRFFWGNLPDMYCPPQYLTTLSDKILEEDLFPGRRSKYSKIRTVTTKGNSLRQGPSMEPAVHQHKNPGLWVSELERIFGFPSHYTDVADLPKYRRLRLVGKAWSVPVVRHLLSPLKNFYRSHQS